MAEPDEKSYRTVRFFHAPADHRVVAVLVNSGFDEYEQFRPFITTELERRHLEEAYSISDPLRERYTKAHLTDDEWPLQIIILNRDKGAVTKPHYHVNERPSNVSTRHQVLICQRGAAEVGVYTKEGEHVGQVRLEPGDLILLLEGHSVEFADDDTKLIEIKQGPFPETDAADKVEIEGGD